MTIGDFREITILGKSAHYASETHPKNHFRLFTENSELKNILSSISGISEENIEYAMVGYIVVLLLFDWSIR